MGPLGLVGADRDERSCAMNEAWKVASHHTAQPFADLDQRIEIDAGIDAHALEHVDEVLRRDVARRARCEGAATKATD